MATTNRRKPVAKKTTVRRKKASGTRRKSTAEPKRIINRKKRPVRKTAGARPKAADRAAAKEKSEVQTLAAENRAGAQVAALIKKGTPRREAVTSVMEKTGLPRARVRRGYDKTLVEPNERIVGSDATVAKKIVAAHKAGASIPQLRVRSGLSPAQIKQIIGENSTDRPQKKTVAKKSAAKKPTAKKSTARAKRSRKAAPASAETADASGRSQGRRGRRANLKKMLDEVWDLDTSAERITEILDGRTIEVTREFQTRKLRPTVHTVNSIKTVKLHDREGRVIEFADENHKSRFVSSREITALK